MQHPKISIIIPIFNTSKYLSDCLQSVLKQTLADIEIIAINDGSTDHSLDILEQSAKIDPRLKVYTHPNMGQSATRNRGIDIAQGEYIYYMDSDDILEPDCLESCYKKAKENDLDIVLFNGASFFEDSCHRDDLKLNYIHTGCPNPTGIATGIESLKYRLQTNHFSPSPCLYISKSELVKKCDVRFIPGAIHEDEHYTFLLHLHARRISCIDQFYFKRRMRICSTMTHLTTWKNINGYFAVCDELLKERQHMAPDYQAIIDLHLSRMLPAVVWKAYCFPLQDRIKLHHLFKTKYPQYIPVKSYLPLFFKKPVDKLKQLLHLKKTD